MAVILNSYDLSVSEKTGLPQPIIYCQPIPATVEVAIPVNVPLAEKLMAIKPNRRTMRLELCFRQVLDSLPENPVIRDFDVLFNPNYEVDILRLMASIGKNKPFQIVWPGRYEDGRLIYAEEGYRDYKVFEIGKYDVTCVI
ncbi:MAG: BREX-3 system P-loop-containing protein BrxF [Oscillospiraceae bacterium]|nr:BREX-3 system P-loop-containing protein BrxF [Oscillospiraceae bacterium]